MDLGLRDRIYLVTGGSRGLGFAAAQALLADGARVLISTPYEATAASAVARLAPDAAADVAGWIVADNADPARPGRLVAAAWDRFGRLDGALISVGGSLTGAGGSIVFVLASSVRVPLADWPSPTGCSRAWPGWSRRSPAHWGRPGRRGCAGTCCISRTRARLGPRAAVLARVRAPVPRTVRRRGG